MQKSDSEMKLQVSLKLAENLSTSIKQMFSNKIQKRKNSQFEKIINQKFETLQSKQQLQINHKKQNYQLQSMKIAIQKISGQNKKLKQQLKSSKSYIQFLQDYNIKLKRQILIWMNQPKEFSHSLKQEHSDLNNLNNLNNLKWNFVNSQDQIKKQSQFKLLRSNFSIDSQKNQSKKFNELSKTYHSTIITNGYDKQDKANHSTVYFTSKQQNTTADKQTQTDIQYRNQQKKINKNTKNSKKSKIDRSEKIQKNNKPLTLDRYKQLKSNSRRIKQKQIQISQFKF